MKAIRKNHGRMLDQLTEDWPEGPDGFWKYDNANGSFMAFHIEHCKTTSMGEIFSLAHYYEQNGDLMRDPEVMILKGEDGDWYPLSFRQDGGLSIDRSYTRWEDGYVVGVAIAQQKDLASFCNTWMQNVRDQQKIKVKAA